MGVHLAETLKAGDIHLGVDIVAAHFRAHAVALSSENATRVVLPRVSL